MKLRWKSENTWNWMILKMLVIKTCKIQQKHCLEKKSTGFNIRIKKNTKGLRLMSYIINGRNLRRTK